MLKKCKIYYIFYMSLLEQETIKKGQPIENVAKLDTGKSKK